MYGTREVGPDRIRRRPLVPTFARVAGYLLVPLYLAGVCASYFLNSAAGLVTERGWIEILEGRLFDVGFGAFAVVGALLLVKRPANPIGWIMAAIATLLAVAPTGGAYATYVMATRGESGALAVFGAWVSNWFWFVFLALALVYLPMLFPDGRLLSRRWIPVAAFAGIPFLAVVVLGALRETLPVGEVGEGSGATVYRIDNPVGIEGLGDVETLPIFEVLSVHFFVGLAGVVASVVVRFRRSRGVERQQMKWFTSALVVLIGASAIADLASTVTGVRWLGDAGFWLSIVGIASLPAAVGVAVLRYRLYEIDLIINRALVYGPLTATLVAAYFGAVVSLQRVFVAITGERSTLAVVASTLFMAALFNPLRRRVQSFVDRRFYRSKYDARKTLEDFSARLRDETDLGVLCDDLVRVVGETMHPSGVSLWLRSEMAPSEGGRVDSQ